MCAFITSTRGRRNLIRERGEGNASLSGSSELKVNIDIDDYEQWRIMIGKTSSDAKYVNYFILK